MAKVDTLPEMYRPLMEGCSVSTPYCAVCGRTGVPLNRHHVVKRSAVKLYRGGVEIPKPTITLCGSGNASGCHGLAHSGRLHFRWAETVNDIAHEWMHHIGGHWEYLLLDEPCDYLTALEMDGWKPLRKECEL